MGTCGEERNKITEHSKSQNIANSLNQIRNNESINKSIKKEKEGFNRNQGPPLSKPEINDLYTYESSLCKIKYKTQDNQDGFGTGFFCEINDDNIPFKKALFTNNHILDDNSIQVNKVIELDYLNKPKNIKITGKRRAFNNEELDYTCIELLDKDKINNYFKIDKSYFDNINKLKDSLIIVLQYPFGRELSIDKGAIIDIDVQNKYIKHNAATDHGSSGSPLIKRYNNNLVLGIHHSGIKDENNNFKYNLATPFNAIIKDIKNKLNNNKNKLNHKNKLNNTIQYKNTINLIYHKEKENEHSFHVFNPNNIFGEKFVENNKDNISLIINGNENKLVSKYNLNIGTNNIKIIIKKKLTKLENMFEHCISLKNIDELKYLNTKDTTNFSCMFNDCGSLSNINALQNWNVSNGNNFSYMFRGCSSIPDINALQNWNVSNGNNFKGMFIWCSSISDINALQNWNVSNGNDFGSLFGSCESLSDINALQNWNVSNGNNFEGMFDFCSSLSDINALKNWNVSNGNNFKGMFYDYNKLSDINALQNWNISNGNIFDGMFYRCKSLSNLNVLKKWKYSNPKYFGDMFSDPYFGGMPQIVFI